MPKSSHKEPYGFIKGSSSEGEDHGLLLYCWMRKQELQACLELAACRLSPAMAFACASAKKAANWNPYASGRGKHTRRTAVLSRPTGRPIPAGRLTRRRRLFPSEGLADRIGAPSG